MSQEPLSRSPDLKRLRDEGYFVQIRGGFLLLRGVPYVDANKHVRNGTLISSLALAGEVAQRPDTHVVHFDGEYPCTAEGAALEQIRHQSGEVNLGNGIVAKHSFSSKPEAGYPDYYDKMTTYAAILCGPASVLKPGVTARTFAAPEVGDDNDMFNYTETASDRAGVGALTERLVGDKLVIIGLGGTGSYILDLIAKTPAREIRLIDGDEFLQHNAFRAPGAPSLEELRGVPKKADYYKVIYSRMHRGITSHPVNIGADNLHLLEGATFAFLCIDGGNAKRLVVDWLEERNIPFVDVGMGLELVDGSLGGILRVTASTPAKRDHVHKGRISFAGGNDEDDLYGSNIQVADLNALNATLAVIKWKKIRGFYRDLEWEHHCTYTTDGNLIINGDFMDAVLAA
jgi:ThiF family